MKARATASFLLLGVLAPGLANAGTQTVLGKSFVVKDPAPGTDPSLRSVVVLGKEPVSDDTIVGDPLANGATVEIVADGANPTAQTFILPPGPSVGGAPGWTALRNPPIGYSYRDGGGVNGALKSVLIKKSGNGTFVVKVTVKGALGPGPQPHLTVVPPAPGTYARMRFTIPAGDTYHVAFGGTLGGAVKNAPTSGTPNTLFKIASSHTAPMLEAACSGTWCDLGASTIYDTATGLQWEQKNGAGGGPNPSNLHDVDNRYTWAGVCSANTARHCQPTGAAEVECEAHTPAAYWANGCEQCGVGEGTCDVDPDGFGAITTVWRWLNDVNASNFAGYSDWRLPSEDGCDSCYVGSPTFSCTCGLTELQTILLAPYPCGTNPCISPVFGPTKNFYYWSAADPHGVPWLVQFGDGYINAGAGEAYPAQVRAVR